MSKYLDNARLGARRSGPQALGGVAPRPYIGRPPTGRSKQRPYTPRAEVFAEKTFHTYYEPMRCVRTSTHKYIVNFEVSTAVDVPADVRESPAYVLLAHELDRVRDHVELYDLAADPWEQENLAGRPEVAETEADLRGRLLRWMRETEDPLLEGPVASPYYYESIKRLRG